MESILARALEYTLKYWLKSFSRDQFKLHGRMAQLCNLDINGDALHASLGLPPELNVVSAKITKLEIKIPYVSNVQVEPIVVKIDRLDVVLKEVYASKGASSDQISTSSVKGSGYGFADKIADGMTLEIGIVNLMLETRRGAQHQGSAAWAPPLASFTMRSLILCTTNENGKVVNLKEARDFSNNKKSIYVFKKLEWESLSVDLLPHPDMFADASLTCSDTKRRDNDGAKRVFFGGERLLEGISGEACITLQRTKQNTPLGLEVQLHVTEAVCPALSEPGLRAFLRFMTGLCACLNRGDMDPKKQQLTEAASRSHVSIIVDHIFLCIKDSEFQLDLLVQSLFFSRASVSDGEITKNLTHVAVAGFFLRDTFSRPSSTLVQPLMQAAMGERPQIPDFGINFCPPINPLGGHFWKLNDDIALISLYALQMKPSPLPPSLASQMVIYCQPLMINVQEEACLRISSFLADGIVVNPVTVLPDFSICSLKFTVKGLDLLVPLNGTPSHVSIHNGYDDDHWSPFNGAILQIKNLLISQAPALKFQLLDLEKDPACFCFWKGQSFDSGQKKWMAEVSQISLFLKTCGDFVDTRSSNSSDGLWKCVDIHEIVIEVAMATSDGSPLTDVPPPRGLLRVKVGCDWYLSNTSVEQLFFVLDLYSHVGRISDEIAKVGRNSKLKCREPGKGNLLEKVPGDTAVSLAISNLKLKFLESSIGCGDLPLVQFCGDDLSVKVTQRTLGGAFAVSSNLHWQNVQVDCVDGLEGPLARERSNICREYPQMRAVLWIDSKNGAPFLEANTVHVLPYNAEDGECHTLAVSATVAGVRLGGGMNYTEALLHRFGVLGPDGGPGAGLSKGLKNLSSGPLSKLLRGSHLVETSQEENRDLICEEGAGPLELEKPDDVDISIEFRDWLFTLEGTCEVKEEQSMCYSNDVNRETRSWHTAFQSLQVKAKSSLKKLVNQPSKLQQYPIEYVTVSIEGLQVFKPQVASVCHDILLSRELNGIVRNSGGICFEVKVHLLEDEEIANWVIENLRLSVREPIEAIATKEELEHLTVLCRSEADSLGRIASGIFRVLKLDKSLGNATLDQLSNLGSEAMGRICSPENISRRSSFRGSECTSPAHMGDERSKQNLEATVDMLEAAFSDAQADCAALMTELNSMEAFGQLANAKQLSQKLEKVQILLTRLRGQMN